MKDEGVIMNSRDNIIDSLRGFAIILVVIGHVAGGFNHSKLIFTGSDFIHDWIYSFHMPFMFIIAGYAHGIKEHFSSGQNYSYYLRKCIIELYLTCLFFSFMYWFLKITLLSDSALNSENFETTTFEALFRIPFAGFDEYWFLCALFFVKILHLLCERYIKCGIMHSLFWIFVFIALYSFRGIIPSFFMQFKYGLYFHMGFMMKRYNLIPKKISPGIILFLAGMLCFCASHFYGTGNVLTSAGASVFMSLSAFVIFYALNISNTFLIMCGVYSMIIYCIHNYIASFLRIIYRLTGLSSSLSPFVLFVFCSMCGVLLPLIIVRLYKNVKCLRWIEYIFYPGRMRKAPLQ